MPVVSAKRLNAPAAVKRAGSHRASVKAPGVQTRHVKGKDVQKAAVLKSGSNRNTAPSGISVIICTNRPLFRRNIFLNYGRQLYKTKELILILNKNRMDVNRYKAMAAKYPNVSVYQIDESTSLGSCLNVAVLKAKYPIITKFDDDDYYSPYYLHGVARCFNATDADVLGKNTCYLYLERKNLLVLFHPKRANQYTDIVMGSTLAFRRTVFKTVKFQDVSRGEDTYFLDDCAKQNLKIYSCDPFNYVCIRRSNRFSHTWSIDEKTILEHSRLVAKTKDFTKFVTRVVRVSG